MKVIILKNQPSWIIKLIIYYGQWERTISGKRVIVIPRMRICSYCDRGKKMSEIHITSDEYNKLKLYKYFER